MEVKPSRYRDRKFCALLYPEDSTHVAAMEKLKTGGYTFAAILHDKDVYEDGDNKGQLKKPHWHVVIKFSNAVWNVPTAKALGIEPNYLQQCSSLDGALLYLVHEGNTDKHQYDLNEVFGVLKTRLASLLADDDEGTRALTIFNLIRNSPGIVTYSEIFEKAVKAGLYGDFRRMGTGVMWLINDHNNELQQEEIRKRAEELKTVGNRLERKSFADFEKNLPFRDFIKQDQEKGKEGSSDGIHQTTYW